MRLKRRKFIVGSAAAAAVAAVVKQAKAGVGAILTRPAASVPPPPPGTGLALPVSFTNSVGMTTQVSPFFSFGLPIGRGDFFDATQKLAIYDATGVTHITDCQVDQIKRGWMPDKSVSHCAISGYLVGQTIAPGQTANFMVRAIAGAAPTTPITSAQIAAASDLKAVCMVGGVPFTSSFNTIQSLYSGTPGTYPQGMCRQRKSGPYVSSFTAGQYLKRDSDGASHLWNFLKLNIDALSPSGPFIMRGYLENTQAVTANPTGTIGAHQTRNQPGFEFVESLDFYNGTTRLWSQGGIHDTRAGTFGPGNISLTGGDITPTYAPGIQFHQYAFSYPVGVYTTGTLPAGVGSAATTTYWVLPGFTAGSIVLCTSRYMVQLVINGSIVYTPGPTVAGTTYVSVSTAKQKQQYIASGGARWVCSTGGVSAGLQPSGPGPTFTDGTVVWSIFTAPIASGGIGTHTVAPKLYTTRGNKTAIAADDSYPYWSGTGTLPTKLLVGYDFTYLTTKTKSIPPLSPTYTALPWQGPILSYIPSTSYLPGEPDPFYIGNQAGSVVDERINFMGPAAMASVYLPTDRGMAISYRTIALCFTDRNNYYFRDERAQQVLVTNHGPDKLGGTYPNMGPTSPNIHPCATVNSNAIGYSNSATDWPGYGGGFTSQTAPEASHNPNPFYWPYLTTGDPMFLDAMLEYASTFFAYTGSTYPEVKSTTVNGVLYDFAWCFWQQERAAGHELKIFSQAEWSCPDDDPANPFFTDVMDDSAAVGAPWMKANVTPLGQTIGLTPFIYPAWPGSQYPVAEVWMQTIIQIPMLHETWKGNRPGWRAMLDYWSVYWCRLWDSDVGGSEKIIDVQWTISGTQPLAGNSNSIFPPDSQLITSGPAAWVQDCSNGGYVPFPPAGNAFTVGLSTQNAKTGAPNYYSGTMPGGCYGSEVYMALSFGAWIGIPQYAKILGRVDALMASSRTSFAYQATATQLLNGNRNVLMWMAKKT